MVDSRQFIKIIVSVFIIFIVLRITEFLRTLPKCACYTEKAGAQNNLDKIVFLENSVIFIALIKIAHSIYEMFSKSSVDRESPYMLFMIFLITIVYTFFTYNVYEYQKSLGSQCECADKWEQNVMYFQALVYALIVAMILVLGLITLSTGSVGDSNFRRVVVLMAVFVTGLIAFSLYGGDMNIFVEQVMTHFQQNEGFKGPASGGQSRCPNGGVPALGYTCVSGQCDKGYIKQGTKCVVSKDHFRNFMFGSKRASLKSAVNPVTKYIRSMSHR